MEPRIYKIPAVNMARLEQEVAKLNKRAEKLGTEPIKLATVEKVTTKRKDKLGFEYDYTVHHCTVEGAAPILNGWHLVAILEPQKNAEMLIREVPGCICPAKYRVTDLKCDHCALVRKRSKVYVLKNGDNHKQVGKSCLADFLGHEDPESMLSGAEYLMDFTKMAGDAESEGWGSMGRGELCVPLNQFVTVCAILIRRIGWVSKASAFDDHEGGGPEPTSNVAWWMCTSRPDDKEVAAFVAKHKIEWEPKDVALAEAVVAWASKIDPLTAGNTYLHDLGVCCRQQFVVGKTRGFVASGINAYNRAESARLAALRPAIVAVPNQPKKHVGTLDKREVFEDLTITLLKSIPGVYPKTLVKFMDKDGNNLVWFASGCPDWLEQNKVVTVKATVEEHNEYQNVPQTVLKRVTPQEAAVPA